MDRGRPDHIGAPVTARPTADGSAGGIPGVPCLPGSHTRSVTTVDGGQ
jgi:hypothetical protein